ncbi:DUF6391 domain-containing protein [Halanaerobaculum tunisiense]
MYLLLLFLFPIFLLVLLIPYKFTIDSIITLLHAPQQIIAIATNPDLRRNHALEHATINVLEEKYGCKNLSGWAQEDGFYISGVFNAAVIEEAAEEGLFRLQQGEQDLVVHKRCGTSLSMANILSALIFFTLLFITKTFSLFNVVIALLLANFLGPSLGVWVQKKFTTSAQVAGMVIAGINQDNYANSVFNRFANQKIFVSTKNLRVYGG